MANVTEVFSNRWWRFDEYEIADGFLRPAPGAALSKYDPWSAYEAALALNRSVRPYMTLFAIAEEIVGDLRNRDWNLGVLCPESAKALTGWARKNGLLGLLLQKTVQVQFAPRWSLVKSLGGRISYVGGEVLPLIASRMTVVRTPTGWIASTPLENPFDERLTSADLCLSGLPLSVSRTPDSWSPASALIRQDDWSLVAEPLDRTWGEFFPSVAVDEKSAYDYPCPLTQEFWPLYAEPVGAFLRAAIDLGQAARQAARLRRPSDHGQIDLPLEELRRIRLSLSHLEQLASTLTPAPHPADNGLLMAWTGPSLIALMAMMILLDLTSRMRLRRCDVCEGLFVSPSPLARYCSERCRWRKQKREQRKMCRAATGEI